MTVKSLCSFNRSSGRDGAVKTAIKLKTAPDIVPPHAAKSTIVRGALLSVLTPYATLAGSKYCNAAVCCCVEKCYPRRENGEVMKLPRRKFLHLAAGAAALPAVSQIATAQTYVRIV